MESRIDLGILIKKATTSKPILIAMEDAEKQLVPLVFSEKQLEEASFEHLSALMESKNKGVLQDIISKEEKNGSSPEETRQFLANYTPEVAELLAADKEDFQLLFELMDRGVTLKQFFAADSELIQCLGNTPNEKASCYALIDDKYLTIGDILALDHESYRSLFEDKVFYDDSGATLESFKALLKGGVSFKDIVDLDEGQRSVLLNPDYQEFRDAAMQKGITLADFTALSSDLDFGNDEVMLKLLLNNHRDRIREGVLDDGVSHTDILNEMIGLAGNFDPNGTDHIHERNSILENMTAHEAVRIIDSVRELKYNIDNIFNAKNEDLLKTSIKSILGDDVDIENITKKEFLEKIIDKSAQDGGSPNDVVFDIIDDVPEGSDLAYKLESDPLKKVLGSKDDAWVKKTLEPQRQAQTDGAAATIINAAISSVLSSNKELGGLGKHIGEFLGVEGNKGMSRVCRDANTSAKSYLEIFKETRDAQQGLKSR